MTTIGPTAGKGKFVDLYSDKAAVGRNKLIYLAFLYMHTPIYREYVLSLSSLLCCRIFFQTPLPRCSNGMIYTLDLNVMLTYRIICTG